MSIHAFEVELRSDVFGEIYELKHHIWSFRKAVVGMLEAEATHRSHFTRERMHLPESRTILAEASNSERFFARAIVLAIPHVMTAAGIARARHQTIGNALDRAEHIHAESKDLRNIYEHWYNYRDVPGDQSPRAYREVELDLPNIQGSSRAHAMSFMTIGDQHYFGHHLHLEPDDEAIERLVQEELATERAKRNMRNS